MPKASLEITIKSGGGVCLPNCLSRILAITVLQGRTRKPKVTS